MPTNRFPDTIEKRELRRRDRRRLQAYKEFAGRPLDYCGMPSAEFLDVKEWRTILGSVTAIELDPDVANDMRIERDRLGLGIPTTIHQGNVFDFLETADQRPFDIYNLDLYGGFLYPKGSEPSRSVSALRSLFATQGRHRRAFVLIATFNVREKGAAEYLRFLVDVQKELKHHKGAEENIRAHMGEQATKLKVAFPFFCWQQASANGMDCVVEEVTTYRSSATMVHFFARTSLLQGANLAVPTNEALVEIANAPLYELTDLFRRTRLLPPKIE